MAASLSTGEENHTYLNTIGEGTQNLTRVFLMFSCSVASSRHHDVCSLADGPAVGSEKQGFKIKWRAHDNPRFIFCLFL